MATAEGVKEEIKEIKEEPKDEEEMKQEEQNEQKEGNEDPQNCSFIFLSSTLRWNRK